MHFFPAILPLVGLAGNSARGSHIQRSQDSTSREATFLGSVMTVTSSSGGDEASVLVAIDFGTTFSGHAYIHKSEPSTVFKVYDWPDTAKGGSTPYCKTPTSLLYVRDADDRGKFVLKEWGWPALVSYTQSARSLRAITNSLSLDPGRPGPSADQQRAIRSKSSVQTDAGYYATQFKLALFRDTDHRNANRRHIQDFPGDITLERLIVDYLRCISDYIIRDLQVKYGSHFSNKYVQWCLTVPAIWDERAKQVMKNCAQKAGLVAGPLCPISGVASPHALGIILEPEAASVYCQQHVKKVQIRLRKGDKLLVADIGGGTIDLVVHAKEDDDPESMKVDEVVSSYGCLGGGTFVDTAFFRLLSEKIGCLETYCRANPLAQLNISKWWQGVKTGFDGRGHTAYLDISKGLSDAWMEYDKHKGISRDPDEYEQVRFRDTNLMQVFDQEVDKVIEQIQQQIQGVRVLMVVGGFSGSRYLRQRLVQRFGSEVEQIITPDDPGSAICHGAALLQQYKDTINSRISRRTYGISANEKWKPGHPPSHKWITTDGEEKCQHIFSAFVRRGERVTMDSSISRSYWPTYKGQKVMSIDLYSSTERSPVYTTEDGCTFEGSFEVDMRDGLKLGKDREVEVTMGFGASTIQVTAVRKNFGNPEVSRGLSNVTFVAG